jgi:hypothetical protein
MVYACHACGAAYGPGKCMTGCFRAQTHSGSQASPDSTVPNFIVGIRAFVVVTTWHRRLLSLHKLLNKEGVHQTRGLEMCKCRDKLDKGSSQTTPEYHLPQSYKKAANMTTLSSIICSSAPQFSIPFPLPLSSLHQSYNSHHDVQSNVQI